jgi:phage repressor protein C with HTH and peptisase S24 domain
VLTAQASLSTAASDQSFTLSSIAQKATGVVAKAAQRAQAKADAIRSQADSALNASADPQPAAVSVSVSAQAGSSNDDQATGSIQLLGILAGGDGQ